MPTPSSATMTATAQALLNSLAPIGYQLTNSQSSGNTTTETLTNPNLAGLQIVATTTNDAGKSVSDVKYVQNGKQLAETNVELDTAANGDTLTYTQDSSPTGGSQFTFTAQTDSAGSLVSMKGTASLPGEGTIVENGTPVTGGVGLNFTFSDTNGNQIGTASKTLDVGAPNSSSGNFNLGTSGGYLSLFNSSVALGKSLLENQQPTSFSLTGDQQQTETYVLNAGQIVTFNWDFTAGDYLPYNDYAFWSVSPGSGQQTLSTVSQVGDYGDSGVKSTTFSAPANGTYTFNFGVQNDTDDFLPSTLIISNLHVNAAVTQTSNDAIESVSIAVSSTNQSYSIDPSGHTTYTLVENPGSPNIASIQMPDADASSTQSPSSFSISYESNKTWSQPQIFQPSQYSKLPSDTIAVKVTQLDGSGNPVASPDDFKFNVTFVSVGDFAGTVTSSDLASTTPTTPTSSNFSLLDTTTNMPTSDSGQAYTGPVSYLQWQEIYSGADSMNVTANAPNVFLKSGPGEDALQAQGGSNVEDGGTGSNFLVGAAGIDGGADTFFTDARGAGVTWDTLVNFHKGDAATLWGFDPKVSSWRWDGISGAGSYQGATLRADVHGTGTTDASITFAGLSMVQAQKLQISTGTAGGNAYLYLLNPGV